ncbi:MAG: carboxypeptidase regulatory-like domain-containing protein [Planctomycetaceae bacterium]
MLRRLLMLLSCLALFQISVASPATAQDNWGQLSGQFLWMGTIPEPKPLVIERDAEICGGHGLSDESLLVNPKTRGVRNVVIWLESRVSVPVHPDYSSKPAVVKLDNKGCRFEPRVTVMQTGGVLTLANSDPVAHNAAVYLKRSTPFNDVIPQEMPIERTLRKAELLPARIDCSIHPWMKAWLLVLDHPYAAVTDADGRFRMPRLPAGEWTFRLWQERPGYLKQLQRNGAPELLDRGQLKLTIPADGTLELGELGLSAEMLKK